MKHSEGNWHINAIGRKEGQRRIIGDATVEDAESYLLANGQVTIAKIYRQGDALYLQRMLEAAPAMLEACKTMLEAWDCRTPEAGIVAIQKAIAQAESEVGE